MQEQKFLQVISKLLLTPVLRFEPPGFFGLKVNKKYQKTPQNSSFGGDFYHGQN